MPTTRMRGATRLATLSGVSREVADGRGRHAAHRECILIGDQAETDIAARDLIVLMRELGRVTAEVNHLKYERQEIIDNALEELRQARDEATRNENIGCAALVERLLQRAYPMDSAYEPIVAAIRARIAR